MRHWPVLPALLLCSAALAIPASTLSAQKTIKVNFSSTAKFKTSEGKEGTAAVSNLTDAEKAKVIASIQANYDDAVGAGKVTVSEGSGGDYDVIVTGGDDPDGKKRWGNAGVQGGPAIVFAARFREKNYTGTALANGIGETAAHEVGHKLGLAHNTDDPPTKMSEGKNVTNIIRANGLRRFNADDKKKLAKSLGLANAEKKGASILPNGLGVLIGINLVQYIDPEALPDDDYLTALASIISPPGLDFGFMGWDNSFVFQGDYTNDFSFPSAMTFEYSGLEDIAAMFGGVLYSLSLGNSSLLLSDPNPDNPAVYQRADITFYTPGAPSVLTLDARSEPNTGGFFLTPEPATMALFGIGIVALGMTGRRRRRTPG